MNKNNLIFTVYKTNLRQNISNPLFYFTAILFVLFTGGNYFIRQHFFTGSGTSDLLLYFSSVPYICILVIPALCYKLSFENYYNFIALKNSQKLLIKTLISLSLFTILVLLMLPGLLLVNIFGDIQWGQLIIGEIMLIFYGLSTICLCLFFNQLIESPIFSFLLSSVALALINSCHLVSIYLPESKLIAPFFKTLSFAYHFDAAGKGIFDTRDFLWLISISCILFLLNNILVLHKKGYFFTKKEKLTNILKILFFVLVILNSFKWYKRIDFSKNKTYSLSKYSKELIKNLNEPLNISFYRSGSLSRLYPQVRDVQDFLLLYASMNKNINLYIQDPDKSKGLQEKLENYGITKQQIKVLKTNEESYIDVFSSIVVEYNGKAENTSFVLSAENLEFELDSKIHHLISNKERFVNIIIGNGMSLSQDYSYIVPWLSSQGFFCNPLYLKDPEFSTQLSLCQGPLLVIGDSNINIEQAIEIEKYILSNKGNGFFAISPFSADISGDWSIKANNFTNLVEVIENWGINFQNKIAADISCQRLNLYSQEDIQNFEPDSMQNYHTELVNYPLWISILPQENAKKGITSFWPVSLELKENAKALLYTSSFGYNYDVNLNNKTSIIETNPFVLREEGFASKEKKNQIIAAEITGNLPGLFNTMESKNSKIYVLSDQYFVNSLMTGYIGGDYGDYRNFDFLVNCLLKLNNENELSELQSRSFRDSSLYKITSVESFIFLEKLVLFIVLLFLPLLILAGALILWFYQRKFRKEFYTAD